MKYIITLLLLTTSLCHGQITPKMSGEQIKIVQKKIYNRLGRYPQMFTPKMSESERKVKLNRVAITPSQNRIHLYFNEPIAHIAIREELVLQWEQMVRDTLGKAYTKSRVQIYCEKTPIERYIPNSYRVKIAKDNARQGRVSATTPLTRNTERPLFVKGLSGRHIALWASHGYYYDKVKNGWIWQRPPLFGTLEDVNTFEYMYRFLMPMLENAGAVLVSPRERDPNPTEIIVDETQARQISGNWSSQEGGFGKIETLKRENPFQMGSYLMGSGSVEYPIKAPRGQYAIYISYKADPLSSSGVEYKVEHTAGVTKYRVNQQIGTGWVYLGTHVFDEKSKVTLTADGRATTDAIRLGGGMGNVQRSGIVSGMPRWAEAARYFMQYSGVPSSIYAISSEEKNDEKDYVDDYKSRGEWAAWLQNEKGVPLDAVVALHTNAGINDTIFGSLTVNSTEGNGGKYTDGRSKFASRDLADMVLTQIVGDIHAKYTKQWTRRSMYDKQYSEAFRTDSPAVLIELLSHQNMNDMILGLDPAFRFDACRAIYKGIVRFIAERYALPCVIQPLAPVNFGMQADGETLKMSWSEQVDQLEPTAKPTGYRLYTRIGNGGFDNGVPVKEVAIAVVRDGVVRSYRITAVNDGGESFPSETLSACFLKESKKIALVVNEFTRLSPPDTVNGGLNFTNFMPFQHDLGIVGVQRNFERTSQFIDNDNPGWGASTLDLATKGVSGNTFDYTMQKGAEVVAESYSYISTSVAAFDPKRKYDKVVKIVDGK